MNKTTSIVIAPLFLLLIVGFIAAIVILLYMALYKRNINKALKENNGKHVPLPDAPSIIPIILIAILIFNTFSLNSQLDELQSNMDSFRINVEHDINNLQNTIEDLSTMIQNENSLISSYDYKPVNLNTDDMTVDLKFNIALKSFTDSTNVSISINDKVAKLEKSLSGKYTGSITVSIFNTTPDAIALISNGETTLSESLYDIYVDDLWREVLPAMKVAYEGSPIYKKGKIYLNDEIIINLFNNNLHYFTDAYVEIFADNKSVKTIDIDYSKDQSEYQIEMDEKIDVANSDSIIDIYVIGKDSAGLTHKYFVFSGNEYNYTTCIDCEELYDSEGNKLTHYIE